MADSSSQQPSLTVLGGPMAGQRLALDESVANLLIGSDPSCDFYLPHDSVSPIHARLWMDLEGAVLHETSSPYGLYVNDDRVEGKRPLRNGDIVWLGPPGGANVVMIQCVLAENAGDEAAAPPAATDDAQAEREALESLEPTLAARPALIAEEPAAAAAAPVWDPEADLSEPPPLPAASHPPAMEESVRTQAFRLPADFAARLASPPPPEGPPPSARGATKEDFDALLVDTPEAMADVGEAPPPPVPVSEHEMVAEETLMDPAAYAPEPVVPAGEPEPTLLGHDPTLVAHEPVVAEPETYVAEPEPEPEPEIVEPVLPEPEPTVMEAFAPVEPTLVPVEPAALASDFDDMVFAVPEETAASAPAEPRPVAPPAVEDGEQETVLLPAAPRPVAAAPPAPAPAPPVPPPPPAAAARPRGAAAAPAPPAAAPAARPAATPRAAAHARPAAPRPPAQSAARAAEPPAAGGSKGLPVAAIAAGVVLVAVAAGGAYWALGRPPTSATAGTVPPAPPATVAAAVTVPPAPPVTEPAAVSTDPVAPAPEPTVAPTEELVTIVKAATPPPRPSAAPSAAATPRPADRRPDPVDPAAAQRARIAAQVTALLGQANASAAARNYDAALTQYDEVLRLDPQNAAGQAAKASATAARAHARKAFVAGRTVVQTEKARGGGLEGFDSSGVNLQKAPDFQGRIEFAMSPASVQPGDPWQLKIYVVNEGKKAIKISSLAVTTMVNGSPSGSGGAPRNREIAPQQRVIVDELSGTWPAGVSSWKTEVKLTAGKSDTLASQLNWR